MTERENEKWPFLLVSLSLLPALPSSSGLIIIFSLNCTVGQLPLVMLLLSFQLSDCLLPWFLFFFAHPLCTKLYKYITLNKLLHSFRTCMYLYSYTDNLLVQIPYDTLPRTVLPIITISYRHFSHASMHWQASASNFPISPWGACDLLPWTQII